MFKIDEFRITLLILHFIGNAGDGRNGTTGPSSPFDVVGESGVKRTTGAK